MPLRSSKVAQVPFLVGGRGLTHTQEVRRRVDLVRELNVLCPCSLTLTGSTLETRIFHQSEGLTLEFWLNESPQTHLNLAIRSRLTPQGVGNDCFGNDIISLTEEIHRADQLVDSVLSPAIALDELRQRGPAGDQLRFIRARLRRREPFYLPTAAGPKKLVENHGQLHLGPALTASIQARVTALFPRTAEISGGTFVGEAPQALQGASLPARILMLRPAARKNSAVAAGLASAMDLSRLIGLRVGVNLNWVDGEPRSLRFLGFE